MAKQGPTTVKVGKLTATYSRTDMNNVVVRDAGTVTIEGVTEATFDKLRALIGVAVISRRHNAERATPSNTDVMRPKRRAKPQEVEFNTYVVSRPRRGKPTAKLSSVVRNLIPEEFESITWTDVVEVALED